MNTIYLACIAFFVTVLVYPLGQAYSNNQDQIAMRVRVGFGYQDYPYRDGYNERRYYAPYYPRYSYGYPYYYGCYNCYNPYYYRSYDNREDGRGYYYHYWR